MKNTRNKRSINTEGNGFVLSPAAQRTTGTLLLYFRDSHFFFHLRMVGYKNKATP
jgi:hypothetical protein